MVSVRVMGCYLFLEGCSMVVIGMCLLVFRLFVFVTCWCCVLWPISLVRLSAWALVGRLAVDGHISLFFCASV